MKSPTKSGGGKAAKRVCLTKGNDDYASLLDRKNHIVALITKMGDMPESKDWEALPLCSILKHYAGSKAWAVIAPCMVARFVEAVENNFGKTSWLDDFDHFLDLAVADKVPWNIAARAVDVEVQSVKDLIAAEKQMRAIGSDPRGALEFVAELFMYAGVPGMLPWPRAAFQKCILKDAFEKEILFPFNDNHLLNNKFAGAGDVFDDVSRLNRLGVGFDILEGMVEELASSQKDQMIHRQIGRKPGLFDGCSWTFQEMNSDKAEGCIARVCLLSDTHMAHEKHMDHLKNASFDILMHGGDLGNEETRSIDFPRFHEYIGKNVGSLKVLTNAKEVAKKIKEELVERKNFLVHRGLTWLQSFADQGIETYLVAGNHDNVLEMLTNGTFVGASGAVECFVNSGIKQGAVAEAFCELYNVIYLHTDRAVVTSVKTGLTLYGSGVSQMGKLGDVRSVASQTNSFRVPPGPEMRKVEERIKNRLNSAGGPVDIFFSHGVMDQNCMEGSAKKKKDGRLFQNVDGENNALSVVTPPLVYAYGDNHLTPGSFPAAPEKLEAWEGVKAVSIGEHTTHFVYAANFAKYNYAYGLSPRVIDFFESRSVL